MSRIGRIGDWTGDGSGNTGAGGGGGRRLATLGDMAAGGAPSGPPRGAGTGSDSDDDDENDPYKEAESWFTGGERSGLSVQNPDSRRQQDNIPGGDAVREVLRRAAQAGQAPEPTERPSGAFSGSGHTLGSDEVESSFIPDPNAPESNEEPAIRHISFFSDGFTIEDGPLLRYDDPEQSQLLAELNAGRAPPSVLNVQPGQPVELRIAKRITEKYVPSPKAAFSGEGHRLGAPVPGESSTAPAPPVASTSSVPDSDAPPAGSLQTRFEVDQSIPTTSVQIRLADGTRMVCRMNLTHNVQDLRNFINASRPENLTRPYTIGTTFPNKVLEDGMATIQDAGLANSVVVQRWL